MTKYTDAPLRDLAASAAKVIEEGGTVFFKWTCGGCGERVTSNEPNTFTTTCLHEEKADGSRCGYVTNTLLTGGNYVTVTGVPLSTLREILSRIDEDSLKN